MGGCGCCIWPLSEPVCGLKTMRKGQGGERTREMSVAGNTSGQHLQELRILRPVADRDGDGRRVWVRTA